jgi:CspA family cold shock protein
MKSKNKSENNETTKGEVVWYNVKQGFGFIKGEDGKDIFIHKSEIPFWTIFLKKGDRIEYTKEFTNKGLKAINLRMI